MTALRIAVASAILCVSPGATRAHYHILLPDKPAVKAGEAVTVTFQFGHPFEHQLFDTRPPKQLLVLAPDGTRTDLAGKLEKVALDGADGKKVTAYTAAFTPAKRGDHVVVAVTEPVQVEGEKLPLQDLVKVVVHVQTQNGWDRRAGSLPLEPLPLTRPYGLRPGIAFRAEFEDAGRPLAGLLVETERYNPTPPKVLPPDEQITGTARTDRSGAVTATLPDPGWWAVTGVRDADGVRRRGTLWVYVDAHPAVEPGK